MSYGNYQVYYEPKFPAASSAYKHGSRGLRFPGTPQISHPCFNELHLLWVNVLITLPIWVPVCSFFRCKMLTVITLSAKPYFLCVVFWIFTLFFFWIFVSGFTCIYLFAWPVLMLMSYCPGIFLEIPACCFLTPIHLTTIFNCVFGTCTNKLYPLLHLTPAAFLRATLYNGNMPVDCCHCNSNGC